MMQYGEPNLNEGKQWSEMDLFDLKNSHRHASAWPYPVWSEPTLALMVRHPEQASSGQQFAS
jgi:hypothetical protein